MGVSGQGRIPRQIGELEGGEEICPGLIRGKGIFKKVIIFSLVAVGHIVDTYIIGEGSVLRTAVIFFYLSNEGISILENAARTGLPIPGKLKAVLEQLREEKEN